MNPWTFRRDYLLAGRGMRGVRKEFIGYCLWFIVYGLVLFFHDLLWGHSMYSLYGSDSKIINPGQLVEK